MKRSAGMELHRLASCLQTTLIKYSKLKKKKIRFPKLMKISIDARPLTTILMNIHALRICQKSSNGSKRRSIREKSKCNKHRAKLVQSKAQIASVKTNFTTALASKIINVKLKERNVVVYAYLNRVVAQFKALAAMDNEAILRNEATTKG